MAARAQRYQRTLGACSGGSEGAPKTNGRLRIDPMLGGGCTEDVVCLCVRAEFRQNVWDCAPHFRHRNQYPDFVCPNRQFRLFLPFIGHLFAIYHPGFSRNVRSKGQFSIGRYVMEDFRAPDVTDGRLWALPSGVKRPIKN